jgi:hypothetical protein
MTAVAELAYVKREHEKQIEAFREVLTKAAQRNYKLQQEVTGGMQVIYCLASQCPDRTLTLKATDLVATMGSLQRKHDPVTDTYSFIALPPSPEEVAKVQAHVEATNEAHDAPPVPIGADEPTDDTPAVAIGD